MLARDLTDRMVCVMAIVHCTCIGYECCLYALSQVLQGHHARLAPKAVCEFFTVKRGQIMTTFSELKK